MPPRNTMAETVSRGAARCMRFACVRYFPSVMVGEVSEIVSGGTPATEHSEYWDGDVTWVTPKDLGKPRNIEIDSAERFITRLAVSSSSARLLPVGTVLLSSRAPIGHIGIAAKPLATNQGFKNIICSPHLHNRYLFHILRGSIDELAAQGRGNTFLEIPAKVVRDFKIPLPPVSVQENVASFLDAFYLRLANHNIDLPLLPPPLTEQRRVVAKVERLAAKIEDAQALRRQAIEEARVLWQRGAERIFEHAEQKFPVRPLADAISVYGGGTPSKANPFYWSGTIPWVTPKDMKVREIWDSIDHITEQATKESPAKLLAPGAVLVVVRGMILAHTFPAAVLRAAATINQDMKALVPKPYLMPEYLCAFFWAYNDRFLALVEKSTHDTRKLETPVLVNAKVPIPPLEEQERIVADVDALLAQVRGLQHLQAGTSAELDALMPSILDKAFRGEL